MSFTVFYFQRLKTWWRTRRILLKSCMFKKFHFSAEYLIEENVDPRDLTNWNSRQSFGLNFFSRKLSSFSYSPSNSIKIVTFSSRYESSKYYKILARRVPLHLCKLWLKCLSRWHFFYSCMSSIWQRLWRDIFILSCDKRRWIPSFFDERPFVSPLPYSWAFEIFQESWK